MENVVGVLQAISSLDESKCLSFIPFKGEIKEISSFSSQLFKKKFVKNLIDSPTQ
jgi:NikR C terminal nickel binding domain